MSSSYFDQLEHELRAAVPRVTSKTARRWSGMRLAGRGSQLALAASLAGTAVIVAFVAVPLLGHHPRPVRNAPQHGAIGSARRHRAVRGDEILYPLGAVPTRTQLLANFAILRRPQNSLDRSWKPECDCAGAASQLTGLTRYVQSVSHGRYRIFFDVEQFILPGQLNMAAGSYVLNIDVVAHGTGNVSSTSFGPNTQFTVWPTPLDNNLWVSVVPDGVATVSWTFACAPAQLKRGFCARAGTQTVTASVLHNVAARMITVLGGCKRLIGPPSHRRCPPQRTTGVTWRAADGHVVASFPGYGNLPAPPFVKGGRGYRVVRALGSTSLAGAQIGQTWAAATTAITRTLGVPADRNASVRDCGIQHESVWTSPAVADPLTIFELDGRLAGYRYGAPVSQIGLIQGPGAVLATSRGLTIGRTVATATRTYGHQLTTSAKDGTGTWKLKADGLSGVVLPTTYPLRRVTDQNRIVTIDAGNVGCAGSR